MKRITKTRQTTRYIDYKDMEQLPEGFFYSDTWYSIKYVASVVLKIMLGAIILFLWMAFLSAIQPTN